VRALGAWMQVVDAPDAESDCRDILCTGMAVFRGTSMTSIGKLEVRQTD